MTLLHPDAVFTGSELRTDTAVRIEDGRIAALEAPTAAAERVRGLLMPGMVNAHSHAFQRAFRGHVQWRGPGEDDFWSWRDAMYRTANRLDPDGIFRISRLCFLEMAEAGITQVGEFHYLHHQPDGTRYDDPDLLARRVIDAALDVGIRIALLRVVYARNGADPLRDDQRRFGDRSADEPLAAVQRLASISDERVSVGLAPHSVRAVPADWMPELASFSGPIHAHVSEQPGENAFCQQAYGATPLQVLANGGLVHDRFTAVHLTFPTEGDVALMRDRHATVCACPVTEQDLGDGFLPLEARTLNVCVGSDSHARIDLFEEARSIELHARALAGRRNVLAPPDDRHGLARRLLRIATVDGARALGSPSDGIAIGAPADLVLIDLDRPAAAGVPMQEAAAFLANPEWVDRVWVAGREIVRKGRHPRREEFLTGVSELQG